MKILFFLFITTISFIPTIGTAYASECSDFLGGNFNNTWSTPYLNTDQKSIDVTKLIRSDGDVVIGFQENGHPSIFYKGYRIDSTGVVLGKITSFLRKGTIFKGAFVAVIYNPPFEMQKKLDLSIESFSPVTKRFCTSVACSYLKIDGFIEKNYLAPSSFIKRLFELKKTEQLDIEFITLNNLNLKSVYQTAVLEKYFMSLVYLGTPVFVGGPSILGVFGVLFGLL